MFSLSLFEPNIELWLVFALISVLFCAVGIILDKITLEDIFTDDGPWLSALCLTTLAPMLFIAFLQGGLPFIPSPEMFFAMFSGILTVAGFALYARVMRNNDVDLVSALLHMAPLHAVLLGVIFLNDHISLANIFGILCIIAAAMLLSIPFKAVMQGKFGLKDIKNLPFLLIQIICLTTVLCGFIADHLVQDHAPMDILFYHNLGMFSCLPVLFLRRKNFTGLVRLYRVHGLKLVFLMIAVEANGTLADLFLFTAYEKGSFTVITTLAAIEPFMVLGLTFALCRLFPRFTPLFAADNTIIDNGNRTLYIRAGAFAGILLGMHFLMV